MPNSGLSQYRQNQISSTAPEKAVLMLYDGAIGFIRSAIKEMSGNNNIVEKSRLIEKTVKIIDYLQSCLDKERGGPIAENLNKLYDYMSIRLTEANLKNDTEKMEEVLNLLQTIREGWNSICDDSNIQGGKDRPESGKEEAGETDNDHPSVSHKDRTLVIKA